MGTSSLNTSTGATMGMKKNLHGDEAMLVCYFGQANPTTDLEIK
jgi:hypothetical protein